MMNHHMPAGPGQHHIQQPAVPLNPHSRRQQEYHQYHGPQQPQSPIHPYGGFPHPAQYYSHAPGPPPQFNPQRWPHPYANPQAYMGPPPHQQQQHPPPQQMPYQQRSPMVVTSQPYPQPMTPITRQTPVPLPANMMQPVSQSPRPVPQHVPQHVHTPVAPPSPTPTPQQEQDQIMPHEEATASPQAPSRRQSAAVNPLSLPPEHKSPFYPQLPWFSTGGADSFPRRARGRRRRRQNLDDIDSVALPMREAVEADGAPEQIAEDPVSEASTVAAPSEAEPETPATSHAPSESDFTHTSPPATPSQATATPPKATSTPAQTQHARRDTRTAIAVPNIPGLAKPKVSPPATDKPQTPTSQPDKATSAAVAEQTSKSVEDAAGEEAAAPVTPPPKPAPKSWAELLKSNSANSSSATITNGGPMTNGASLPKSASLADALKQYTVQSDRKFSFLEPRGLVNTGNMCYMNSILQVLIFCVPFYNFLDQVRQRTVHSIQSNTPLIDAMLMLMNDFKVLATADSVAVLRNLLNQQQVEQYGDPLIPQYVYDAIAKLDRFVSMRRGHQQDSEEFLGFLLEGLHDECVMVMRGQSEIKAEEYAVTSPSEVMSPGSGDGWLEVGPKQKASVTRTAGQQDAPTPITKIFGGHFRSVLRIPGLKDSVVLEPYKPLQLDIGAPHVNNIIDALKGITRTEALQGDFGGKTNSAKKQVFIESLPPILILHLKRFQYDSSGTQKIWKKVGYPLELEIPKEVFPPANRGGLAVKGGLPKYKLTAVVYHHGKSAAGGHYTVDILREDGREWVRVDDTIIRRVRPEDVAEGGAEEDPKLLAKALEQHKNDQELQNQRNMYQGLDEAEKAPEEEKPWSEVNGHVPGHRKWNSIANTNGTSTPNSTTGKRTPTARKEGVRDNKVAYILLYERIRA